MIAALVFTVALLVTTAYFIMGSIPLLILKHDTPVDFRKTHVTAITINVAQLVAIVWALVASHL